MLNVQAGQKDNWDCEMAGWDETFLQPAVPDVLLRLQGITGVVANKALATQGMSSYRYLGVLVCFYPIQSLFITSVDYVIG